MSPISPIIPILQRCIDISVWPLWFIALTMLTLAIRACWAEFTK